MPIIFSLHNNFGGHVLTPFSYFDVVSLLAKTSTYNMHETMLLTQLLYSSLVQISGHYNVNMHDSEFVMGNFGGNSPSLFINK